MCDLSGLVCLRTVVWNDILVAQKFHQKTNLTKIFQNFISTSILSQI